MFEKPAPPFQSGPHLLDGQIELVQFEDVDLQVLAEHRAVLDVRQGKRFEVELAGTADDRALTRVGELAGELLANPVIEEFTYRIEE